MKKLALLLFVVAASPLFAQTTSISGLTIPECQVKTIDGTPINTLELQNGNNPFIICFWQSCCNSNLTFMDALNDLFEELTDDYEVKVFAISVDDIRSSDKVKSLVNGKGWEFDFFLDPNCDFKRAMNVSLTPQCFIFDGKKKLVWQKSGFMNGDENLIQDVLDDMKSME